MQIVFWVYTQPVNRFWLQSTEVGSVGAGFFAINSSSIAGEWTKLRDQWEYSHIVRAGLVFLSFLCLLLSIAKND